MTQDPVKAIETLYAGCRFRSRLEARWAVFFDRLGVAWRYEAEGYELPSGRYLPDFTADVCLANHDREIFVEVKGILDEEGFRRLITAAFELPRRTTWPTSPQILVLGDIPRPGVAWLHTRVEVLDDEYFLLRPVFFDRYNSSTRLVPVDEAAPLRRRWLADVMTSDDLRSLARQLLEPVEHERLNVDPQIDAAYSAARAARFEFGESG